MAGLTFDVPTAIALIMLLSALFSTQNRGRGRSNVWRSSYMIVFLAVLHLAFLYQLPRPQLGNFSTEAWAAVTAAAIAGIAADDDADAVGLLLVVLGAVQVMLLAGMLNLRTA